MSLVHDLLERLRVLVYRRREERELAEELAQHVEMEAEYQRSKGAAPAEALRRGHIALGGMERVKEDVRDARGTRLLEDSTGDLAYTFRTLSRRPGFAIVVILTLALGIGGTTAVFSAVDAVLLQPLPYSQPGQLVRLYQSDTISPNSRQFVTPVHYLEFRERLTSFDGVAAFLTYDETGADIGAGTDVHRIRVLPTSANYFDVLRVPPAVGRPYEPQHENGPDIEDVIEAAPVVVVSYAMWQERFGGDVSAIGRTLVMNGKGYTVVGVMPRGFKDPVAGAIDAWVPIDLTTGKSAREATNHYLSVVARLKPGVPLAHAQAELTALTIRLGEQYPNSRGTRAHLYPLKEDIVGSSSTALEIMLGAVGLVLILVCVNIANLMLVRASERTREFAVRSALGAGQGRLMRQLLIESLTLAVAGAVAGLLVARMAMSAMVVISAGSIPRLSALSLDFRLLGFALGVATCCAVLFGLAPALHAARTQPGDALREQDRAATSGRGAMRLREWLVVSQVAVAFVLLVGAGLLLASFRQIKQLNLGIAPAGVLTFELNLPEARYDSLARARFYDTFDARLMQLAGVTAAGGISKLPATGAYHNWGARAMTGPLAGDATRRSMGAANRVVSGEYFRAVGIPTIAGRTFDARDDATVPGRVVISRNLADRLFPGVSAVGQVLNSGRTNEIIGVVGDVAVDNEGRSDYYVYHAHRQFAGDRNWALTQVVASSSPPAVLQPEIRRTLASADPQLVMFRPMMLDDAIGRGAAQRLFTLRILLAFAAMALAVAGLGLFGVLSYGVRTRSREFGIRMALGAERRTIGGMVLRQGLLVTSVGIALGLLGALALSKVMASALFHTSPIEPRVLIGAVIFMLIVAGTAAYLPTHRATGVDPRDALQ